MVLRCGLISLWKRLKINEEDSWKLEIRFGMSGTIFHLKELRGSWMFAHISNPSASELCGFVGSARRNSEENLLCNFIVWLVRCICLSPKPWTLPWLESGRRWHSSHISRGINDLTWCVLLTHLRLKIFSHLKWAPVGQCGMEGWEGVYFSILCPSSKDHLGIERLRKLIMVSMSLPPLWHSEIITNCGLQLQTFIGQVML